MAKKITPEKITAKKEALPPKISRNENISADEGKTDVAVPEVEKTEEDYLQQYQYVRELPLGDPRTNPREGKAARMKKILLSQDMVKILIPVESGSDPSVPLSVTLNGYRLDLPRNTYIDVPEQIAEVVMRSQKQTVQALSQMRTDRNKEVQDAL